MQEGLQRVEQKLSKKSPGTRQLAPDSEIEFKEGRRVHPCEPLTVNARRFFADLCVKEQFSF
jgi:hypothetical protein